MVTKYAIFSSRYFDCLNEIIQFKTGGQRDGQNNFMSHTPKCLFMLISVIMTQSISFLFFTKRYVTDI